MPLNFDTEIAFASPPPGSDDCDKLIDQHDEDTELIGELKLSLIGNFELKNRLLADESFATWFGCHLKSCVKALASSEVRDGGYIRKIDKSIGAKEGSEFGAKQFIQVLSDLKDALIVLRLLEGPVKHRLGPSTIMASGVSSASSVSSVSKIPQGSVSDTCPSSVSTIMLLENCTLELLFLMELFNEIVFQLPINALACGWDTLSAIYCDTVFLIIESGRVEEKEKEKLSKNTSLGVLWTSVLNVFSKFANSDSVEAEGFIFMTLAAFDLVPFLLEADLSDCSVNLQSYAERFMAEIIRYSDIKLGNLIGVSLDSHLSIQRHLERPLTNTSLASDQTLLDSPDYLALCAAIIAIAQISNYFQDFRSVQSGSAKSHIPHSETLYRSLIPLLYAENSFVLNVAALNLLQLYSTSVTREIENLGDAHSTYEKLFPRIVELLDHHTAPVAGPVAQIPGFLKPPICILSEVCLESPGLCAILKNTNVDKKIMDDLLTLLNTSPVFEYLQALKISYNKTKKLANFSVLKQRVFGFGDQNISAHGSHMSLIASHLLLLGAFTSSNEEFRRRVTTHLTETQENSDPSFLCLAIFEIVENYHFLCSQILLNYKVFVKLRNASPTEASKSLYGWLSENAAVIVSLIEHPINVNTFFLIRSLSRSVSTVRTFFVDCNSIKSAFEASSLVASRENSQWKSGVMRNIDARYDREAATSIKGNFIYCMLRITSLLKTVDRVMPFFTATNDSQMRTIKSLFDKKIVLIACLANFILDFGSFRYEIVNNEKTFKDLASLFPGAFLYADEDLGNLGGFRDKSSMQKAHELDHLKVQLGILQVIENYLYNENEESRKLVWDYFPLSLIFELSLYGTIESIEQNLELHKLRVQQKVMAFGIMRNLTAASMYFSEAIEKLYFEYTSLRSHSTLCPDAWDKYLISNLLSFELFTDTDLSREAAENLFMENDEFVLRLLQQAEYIKLIVAINYLEDHRYTNISIIRNSNFPCRQLLRIWKRFLGVKFSKVLEKKLCGSNTTALVSLANNINEVKVSICWIIINLTWNDDHFGGVASGESHFRLMEIISSTNAKPGAYPFSEPNLSRFDHDDDDEERTSDSFSLDQSSRRSAPNDTMSVRTRAKLLYKFGFFQVLDDIKNELLQPQIQANGVKDFSMARFDSLNSNDLFEKCTTAQHQISALLTRDSVHRSGTRNYFHGHPLRRLSGNTSYGASNTRADRSGMEVSGFWSEGDVPRPEVEGSRIETAEGQDSSAQDEEIDEYWIR